MSGIQLSEKGLEALLDLETGMQSKGLEIRISSVLRFINFFEEYPDPLLANNAFLKLSDYWWISDNVFRQCILKVFRRSEHHLSKVISKDEILRRIVSVLSSNDPIAKAFTLRLHGYVDCITVDRVGVHHKIRLFLCQRDCIELNAAIYAADRSSATSSAFAEATFPGLEPIIRENKYDSLIAPKIIDIYRNMHHTDELAQRENIHLCSIFRSMTVLCLRAIYLVPTVLSILIDYLKLNPTRVVQDTLLSCSQVIIKTHAHRVDSEKFMALLHHGLESDDPNIMAKSFRITASLCNHDIFVYRLLSEGGNFYKSLLAKFEEIQSKVNKISDTRLNAFVKMLLLIDTYCKTNASIGSYDEIIASIERAARNYIQIIPNQIITSGPKQLRHLETLRYSTMIVDDSRVWESMLKAHIPSNYYESEYINEVVRSSIRIKPSLVADYLTSSPITIPHKTTVKVVISYINEKKMSHTKGSSIYYNNVHKIIDRLGSHKDIHWYKYVIACEALISGQPLIAVDIFEKLKFKVFSENNHNWIRVLLQVSNSSLIIREDSPWVDTFSGVLNHFWSALTILKINYLELMVEIHTTILHMVVMLDIRDKGGDANLCIIPLGVLVSFARKMKNIYRRFDSFTNNFSNLGKRSSRTIQTWANFCYIVSNLLEVVVSQKRMDTSKDDNVPDISFIESYRSLQLSPIVDMSSKSAPGVILVKDFLHSLVLTLRNMDIIPRKFCRLCSTKSSNSQPRKNWSQF